MPSSRSGADCIAVTDGVKQHALSTVREDLRVRKTWWLLVAVSLVVVGCKGSAPRTQIYTIGGGGMANTLANGDKVKVELTTHVARGDIIVFDGNKAGGTWSRSVVRPDVPNVFFKRVIAVGGDTIACPPIAAGSNECAAVVVDGRPLAEAAYTYGTANDAVTAVQVPNPTHVFAPVTVPAGHLFVMGDHRDDSVDSREDGPIAAASVIGKVVAITAPTASPVPHS